MQVAYSSMFELPLPPGHRFPMSKYRLLYERVVDMADELHIRMVEAPPASREELQLVHDSRYLDRIFAGQLSKLEQRRIGFPWSRQLVERAARSTGGTIAVARAASREGFAVNLAGGTHHAAVDRGQGFCVFNDVAVAIRVLQQDRLCRSAVVLDCDVHQGNGTAEIFANDPNVTTCSIHGARNFPFAKFGSDVDIALPDGTGDAAYLDALHRVVLARLPLGDADILFYLAGADPFVNDRLGRMRLSKQGLARRDEFVLGKCKQLGLPVVVVMAGGYSPDVVDIVDLHVATVRIAARVWQTQQSTYPY